MQNNISQFKFILVFVSLIYLAGCASNGPSLASPDQLKAGAPAPVQGNTGAVMFPYTTDEVTAEWVDKALNAKMGAAIGSAAGIYAGRKAAENIPIFGGMIGQKLGEFAGREVAIKMSGGREFIQSSSDLSFNSEDDLAVYLYAYYGTDPNYSKVLDATSEIYPKLKARNMEVLTWASHYANGAVPKNIAKAQAAGSSGVEPYCESQGEC